MHKFRPLQKENDGYGYANYLPDNSYQTSPLKVKGYEGQADDLECGLFEFHGNQAACSQIWPFVCICNENRVLLYKTRDSYVGIDSNAELKYCAYVVPPCHRNAEILYLTVSILAGYERLIMVTTHGTFYCYKTSELWDSIKELDGWCPMQLPKTKGELGFTVSNEQVWGVAAHPTLPLIAVSSNARDVSIFMFSESGGHRKLASYSRLPGNIPHVEIIPLEKTSVLAPKLANETVDHAEHKFIVSFAGITLEHDTDESPEAESKRRRERGFAGYWILNAKETKENDDLEIESLGRGTVATQESAWLVRSIGREALLKVDCKAELVGVNFGEVRNNRTWGGTFEKSVENEKKPSLRAESSKHSTEMDEAIAKHLTEAEQSILDKSLTIFGLDTQFYLCEPSSYRWLAASTARTLYAESQLPVSDDDIWQRSFTLWTWMEDISLLGVVSRTGIATFLRLTRFEDETVGFRPEFAVCRDDHILGICSMPMHSCVPMKKSGLSGECLNLMDHHEVSVKPTMTTEDCSNPIIGKANVYSVIIYLEGGATTTLIVEASQD